MVCVMKHHVEQYPFKIDLLLFTDTLRANINTHQAAHDFCCSCDINMS